MIGAEDTRFGLHLFVGGDPSQFNPSVASAPYQVEWLRSGWPAFALEFIAWTEPNAASLNEAKSWRTLFVPAARELPVVPIWAGFVVDTAFYAAVAFVVWSFGGSIPTLVRGFPRQPGHCRKCGYDLRGSRGSAGPCPECGA
jgi:hypothetical protein